ncbi:oligosaccharide repeat unit polymerase [Capnocytophaga sputigena]|uniref:oligosaccharide repeat unit polymerase n=1 Tax=Capnocytophaga sputigena TaxID=1019 RepID=UPI00288A8397|nr:oligosaccharide repeat unit polymerase [Capnocytophaga sputigena]
MIKKEEAYKGVRVIFYLNVFYILVSYLYAIFVGSYNGDFLNVSVNLGLNFLTLIVFFCILPYWVQWKIYKYFKKKINNRKCIYIDFHYVKNFVYIILLLHVFITIIFGVNRVGAPPYEAPAVIKIFIQILLRFNSFLWGSFLFFLLPKKNKGALILTIFLMVLIGVLRGSFGIIYNIFLLFLIKYFNSIVRIIKKKIIFILIGIAFFPVIVEFAYSQRDIIRNSNEKKIENESLIAGKLIGRMSSFSNTAILVDNVFVYFLLARTFDNYFYQKGMLVAISTSYEKRGFKTPEKVLLPDTPDGSSFMLGTTGILIFSLYNSPIAFILNLCSIIIVSIIIYRILLRIKFKYNKELAYLLLVGPTLSGVAGEYAFNLIIVVIFFITLFIFRFLQKLIKYEGQIYRHDLYK